MTQMQFAYVAAVKKCTVTERNPTFKTKGERKENLRGKEEATEKGLEHGGIEGVLVGSVTMPFTDGGGNVMMDEGGNVMIHNEDGGAKGLNPGLIVLLVIGGLVLLFLLGNYALYMYAQKTLPPKKKKHVSKKKMRRERLKQGISASGE
ncbi:DNA-binding protein S1FA2 [Elaeis guineensis]|uniref:DNA-binding protein S1FA1 n=1 Tax=Elaeis guineensis var. tenera TaxID=51953 RepID=A0A6J0PCV6_ELAGV|nr:DNA-binding protein S1FA1 [Elaeis guineensis]